VFECVLNISEGQDQRLLEELSLAAGASLRDRHSDAYHHRSVFTLINEPGPLVRDVHALITRAYGALDLREHTGVHPRFGVVDVVPFVALDPRERDEACTLRDDTARWIAQHFDVPVFLYGPLDADTVRTLPDIRRDAFTRLSPDLGPSRPSPARGASAVGCRELLVAWNLWLEGVTLPQARVIAGALRSGALRTLAFAHGDTVQVSCNVVDVHQIRLSQVYDAVLAMLPARARVQRAELVGLAPRALLEQESPERLAQLDLSVERTIEARLESRASLTPPGNDAR